MKKSDNIPLASLLATSNSMQIIAADISRPQTPPHSHASTSPNGSVSTASAPTSINHGHSLVRTSPLPKAQGKSFKWVQVDPTEVPGSLRFRMLPVLTPQTPTLDDAASLQGERSRPKTHAKGYPIPHETDLAAKKRSKLSSTQGASYSEKVIPQTKRRKCYPSYRLIPARWNQTSLGKNDSDAGIRPSAKTDHTSPPVDFLPQLPDIEPLPLDRNPSDEVVKTKFVTRRQTYFDIVLNQA